MPLKPFKYIVQAVALETNDDGDVVAEHAQPQPSAVYSRAQLDKWAEDFEAGLNKDGDG